MLLSVDKSGHIQDKKYLQEVEMKKRLFSILLTLTMVLSLFYAWNITANAEPFDPASIPMQATTYASDTYNFIINNQVVSVPSNAYLGDNFSNERLYVYVAQHELNFIDSRDKSLYHVGIGCYAGVEDGLWGPNTRSAVKAFQAYNNLSTDGIVGPDTWYALHQYHLYW